MNSRALFRLKLGEIASKIEIHRLERLKFLCKDVIPEGDMEQITSPEGLFMELEHKMLLAPGHVKFLQKCLKVAGRDDLAFELELLEGGEEKGDEEVDNKIRWLDYPPTLAEVKELLKEFEENVVMMNISIQNAVNGVRKEADTLDKVFKNCQKISAVGRLSAIFGDCVGVVSCFEVIANKHDALLVSTAFGMTGAVTNVCIKEWERYQASSGVQKADRILRDVVKKILTVKKKIDSLKYGEGNESSLVFLAEHVIKRFGSDHFILALIEESLPVDLLYKCNARQDTLEMVLRAGTGLGAAAYAGIDTGILTPSANTGEASAIVADSTAGDVGASIAARDSSNVMSEVAALGDTYASCEEYVTVAADIRPVDGTKIAVNAAEDVGTRLGVGLGVKVINAAALFWDCKTLFHVIRDIISEKGSDAAQCLRQKASAFEALLPVKRG